MKKLAAGVVVVSMMLGATVSRAQGKTHVNIFVKFYRAEDDKELKLMSSPNITTLPGNAARIWIGSDTKVMATVLPKLKDANHIELSINCSITNTTATGIATTQEFKTTVAPFDGEPTIVGQVVQKKDNGGVTSTVRDIVIASAVRETP